MINKPTLLELKDVNFSYTENRKILSDINFKIYDDEYVCIIGHNGSGKSTISKILCGLLKPQKGNLLLMNEVVNSKNLQKLYSLIGVVFQNPDNQFVGLAVEDDIAFGLENRKFPSDSMPEIINLTTKALGINNLLDKNAAELSGGQKQKVAIAGVLAINPRVIIFDESTSMLDPQSKNEIKKLMVDLRKVLKKTIISITHDMEEVINADRVIFLDKGKISFIGKPYDFFTKQKKLNELHLDYPFITKLCHELNNNGINIEPTIYEKEFLEKWNKK